MTPLKLLNPSYLFDPTPGYTFLYFWPLILFFGLAIAGSLFLKKKFKNLPDHIPVRIREFSVIGVILTLLRDQDVPYLAMRLWLVIFFLLVITYTIWSWRDHKKTLLEESKRSHTKEVKDKYLPVPKKKKKR